ncbi:MAG: glycosyl hydrolase 53 family protein [Lewinellaceae bacterium]|nr:glycosyl hydrolase 53 family protein [Lewinellaceae bacterium]
MEDCGVTYYEDQVPEDPYAVFRRHGCNLVRLRLWHTPSWYDGLNEGTRYSDLDDVKKAIARAKYTEWRFYSIFTFRTGGRTQATSWRRKPGCPWWTIRIS